MSGSVQADHAARSLAQREYEKPVSLQAGAGTGKTAVLVARVCVWCLGDGWTRTAERLEDRVAPASPDRIASETLRRVVAIHQRVSINIKSRRIERVRRRVGRCRGAAFRCLTLVLQPISCRSARAVDFTQTGWRRLARLTSVDSTGGAHSPRYGA